MKLPSAGALDRGITCSAAYAFPRVQRESNFGASRGHGVHNYIAHGLLGDVAAANSTAKILEVVDELEIDIDHLRNIAGGGDLEVEIAWRWHSSMDEFKILGRMLEGGTPDRPPDCMDGIADAVKVHRDVVEVTDWKTGRSYVPPARYNWQIKFNCYAAAKVFGKSSAIGKLYNLDTKHLSEWRFDDMDLEVIRIEMLQGIQRIYKAREAVERGNRNEIIDHLKVSRHCDFCPSFSECPAHVGTATAMIETQSTNLTPELAATAWQRLKEVKGAVKRVERALEDYVRQQGAIPTTNGRELKMEKTTPREYMQANVALEILQAEGYSLQQAAATMNVVKWKLAKAVGNEEADRLESMVRRAGGISKSKANETLKEVKGADA